MECDAKPKTVTVAYATYYDQVSLLEKFQALANIALEWSKRTESDERSHGGAVAIATKLAALADEKVAKT